MNSDEKPLISFDEISPEDYKEIIDFLREEPKDAYEQAIKLTLEYELTSYRKRTLELNPILGDYGFEHLAQIHSELFRDILGDAGQLRETLPHGDLHTKIDSNNPYLLGVFPQPDESLAIITQAQNRIMASNNLKDLADNKERFAREFAINYALFNMAHPFSEGNGRATRVLFNQLAKDAGYSFDYTRIDKDEWDRASLLSGNYIIFQDESQTSFRKGQTDPEPLIQLINESLSELKEEKELGQAEVSLAEQVKIKQEAYKRMVSEHFKDNPELLDKKLKEIDKSFHQANMTADLEKVGMPRNEIKPDIEVTIPETPNKDLDKK
ncbi:Probable adenosine monophosphate-protein transferase fic [Moraxella lacunata]|uniref:protein adenylyltransferase n=1 Tax=Moraxella lacunata TaxID=477 RepID=A0A378UC00_MORLA|nr:Fic family protein [Moraxella lacunata]STZ74914.1 Probable adenosine monophosphate-protein transferase fic [Moraxella lacunata]